MRISQRIERKKERKVRCTSEFSFLDFSISMRSASMICVRRTFSDFTESSSKRMDAVPLSEVDLIMKISERYVSDCSRIVRISTLAHSSCWRSSSYCVNRLLYSSESCTNKTHFICHCAIEHSLMIFFIILAMNEWCPKDK